LVAGQHRVTLPADWSTRWPDLSGNIGKEIVFGLRPNEFQLAGPDPADPARIAVTALTVEALGDEKNVLFVPPFDQTGLTGDTRAGEAEPAPLWTARLEPDAPVRFGDEISLLVDWAGAYFFDPATGAAIGAGNQVSLGA
jgi:multiple sugar transport system ATP-binding protein